MIQGKGVVGFDTIEHQVDLCVIGAGPAGLAAAISAARHGIKVALMHDRPVVGGNSSSEIRMWIRGAHGRDNRETGIVEELALANLRRNPTLNFSIWDSVTYEAVINEPNIELILNCSCLDAEMHGEKIISVKGWQTTTQRFHRVCAKLFADCSGDSVLAPITGAQFRMGRESSKEFNEDIAPKVSDAHTMGMSCLLQVRETEREIPFKAPEWAIKFTDETISHRVDIHNPDHFKDENFWWIELGGMNDSIGDTEKLRHELVRIAFGVWDYYKNSGRFDAKNWELEWVGFLPGKRESRRYIGDYILTQNDVRSGGHFDDLIAYGGWTMDDHDPDGFRTKSAPTIWHPAPSPFGIPYRCLYSANVPNLMFAGRNISCTHTAASSCRVMATCATLGQALGTAAAIAIRNNTLPRGVYKEHIAELKQELMEDDCYLPFNHRRLSPVMDGIVAHVSGKDASVLFDGVDRTLDGESHLLELDFGEELIIELPEIRNVAKLSFIFDSDINRDTYEGVPFNHTTYPMRCNRALGEKFVGIPETLLRDFDVYIDDGSGFQLAVSVTENYRRLWTWKGNFAAKRIKLVPKCAYGAKTARVYSLILN